MHSEIFFKNSVISHLEFVNNRDIIKFVSTDNEHSSLGELICEKIISFNYIYDFEEDYYLSSIFIFGVKIIKLNNFFEVIFDMLEIFNIKCKNCNIVEVT